MTPIPGEEEHIKHLMQHLEEYPIAGPELEEKKELKKDEIKTPDKRPLTINPEAAPFYPTV